MIPFLSLPMKEMLTVQDFETLIYVFRGKKVMLDIDLAALYETETKKLKQQVRRNKVRFPADFMFELTKEEKDHLLASYPRLSNLKHASVHPMVFTEQGVAMLSSVLTSQKAIDINIGIMRAFAHYRALLIENKELKKDLQQLDAKLTEAFSYLLEKIDALSVEKTKPLAPIGFKQKEKNKRSTH